MTVPSPAPITNNPAKSLSHKVPARWVITASTVAILGAAVLLAGACSRAAPPPREEIRPVRAMVIAPAQTEAVAEFSGEVRPRVESRVGFQVGGRITNRLVEVGQVVKAGQAMASIDAADYRLSAAASSAQLLAAQAERDQLRLDYKRFTDLNKQGFTSGADLERRKAELDAAEARYEQAAAQANVSGNQTAYATLKAPVSGIVIAIDAEVGQVVSAGQSVVRVAQTREKEVAIAIPENRLANLRRIPEVKVTLWTGGAPLRGRVREISPIADAATRTFPARISLIDPPESVALGMTATVTFAAPLAEPVIALPLQALLQEGGATYVWQIDSKSSTVRKSAIKVANVAGNDVVVAGGVTAGDTIVTAGVHLLKEGQKVKLLDGVGQNAGSAATPAAVPQKSKAADKKSSLPAALAATRQG